MEKVNKEMEIMAGLFSILTLDDAVEIMEKHIADYKRDKGSIDKDKRRKATLSLGVMAMQLSMKISHILKADRDNVSETEALVNTLEEIEKQTQWLKIRPKEN